MRAQVGTDIDRCGEQMSNAPTSGRVCALTLGHGGPHASQYSSKGQREQSERYERGGVMEAIETVKHTPGPWTVEVSDDAYGTYRIVEQAQANEATADEDIYTADEDYANARLIAEAPALLEALRTLVRANDRGYQRDTMRYEGFFDTAREVIERIEG
jgi:hypothetical protein